MAGLLDTIVSSVTSGNSPFLNPETKGSTGDSLIDRGVQAFSDLVSNTGTATTAETSGPTSQEGGPILVAGNGTLPVGNGFPIAQASSTVPDWFQPIAPGGARPFVNSFAPAPDITANYPQAASVVTQMFGAANIVPNALTATITNSGVTTIFQRAMANQPIEIGAASLDGNRNLTKVDMDRGASDFFADVWYRGGDAIPLGSGQTPSAAQQQWRDTFFQAYLAQEVAHQVTHTLPHANKMNATEGEIIGESASLQVTPAYASETLWRAMAHELRGGNRAGAPAYGGITDVTKYALGQAIIQAGGGGGSTNPYQVGDSAFAQMKSIVGNVPSGSTPRVIVDTFLTNLSVERGTLETTMVDAFKAEAAAILNAAPGRSGAPTNYTPATFQR